MKRLILLYSKQEFNNIMETIPCLQGIGGYKEIFTNGTPIYICGATCVNSAGQTIQRANNQYCYWNHCGFAHPEPGVPMYFGVGCTFPANFGIVWEFQNHQCGNMVGLYITIDISPLHFYNCIIVDLRGLAFSEFESYAIASTSNYEVCDTCLCDCCDCDCGTS